MSSVTVRIKEIKKEDIIRPRGGYVPLSDFDITEKDDGNILQSENISPSLVGTVVDYMTRYMVCGSKEEAFFISIMGYKRKIMLKGKMAVLEDFENKTDAMSLCKNIRNLTDKSIISACRLATYDIWVRNPMVAMARDIPFVEPDMQTIQNIRTMVERSLAFFEEYGKITANGFNFETDGYTDLVTSGDGDFLTKDTLWDFKVSKSKPSSDDILQIIMYYYMGKHSKKSIFDDIQYIGIFNPRLNTVYRFKMDNIFPKFKKIIETKIIGYKE